MLGRSSGSSYSSSFSSPSQIHAALWLFMNGLQPRVHTVLYMVSANASQAEREREKRPAIYTVINYSQVHIVRKKNKLLYKIRQRKSKPERIRRSSVQSAIECQCTGTVTLSLTVSVSCAVQFAPTRLLSCLLQASTNVNV